MPSFSWRIKRNTVDVKFTRLMTDIFNHHIKIQTERALCVNSLSVVTFILCVPLAVQSLNSLNDQIANFMVTGPKPLEQEEPAFRPPEKETMQKSMTLMRHLLVDAQVQETVHLPPHKKAGGGRERQIYRWQSTCGTQLPRSSSEISIFRVDLHYCGCLHLS